MRMMQDAGAGTSGWTVTIGPRELERRPVPRFAQRIVARLAIAAVS